jgi:chromosome segregation ATPase
VTWPSSQRQAEGDRAKSREVLQDKKQREAALLTAWSEVEELRSTLKQVRAERGKTNQEAEGRVSRLEAKVAEEKTLSTHLRTRIAKLEEEAQGGSRKISELQQILEHTRQSERVMRIEIEDMRVRLEEAEFAQLALREGGARLARELAEKEKGLIKMEGMGGPKGRSDVERGGRV